MIDSRRLDGRTAIITGGGGGLGLAAAHRFAAEGASILIADIDDCLVQYAVQAMQETGASAQGVTVDVTDDASVAAMAAAV